MSSKSFEADNYNKGGRSDSFESSKLDDLSFSPYRLFDAFQKSIIFDENGKAHDIRLKEYLIAYEEIVK